MAIVAEQQFHGFGIDAHNVHSRRDDFHDRSVVYGNAFAVAVVFHVVEERHAVGIAVVVYYVQVHEQGSHVCVFYCARLVGRGYFDFDMRFEAEFVFRYLLAVFVDNGIAATILDDALFKLAFEHGRAVRLVADLYGFVYYLVAVLVFKRFIPARFVLDVYGVAVFVHRRFDFINVVIERERIKRKRDIVI